MSHSAVVYFFCPSEPNTLIHTPPYKQQRNPGAPIQQEKKIHQRRPFVLPYWCGICCCRRLFVCVCWFKPTTYYMQSASIKHGVHCREVESGFGEETPALVGREYRLRADDVVVKLVFRLTL